MMHLAVAQQYWDSVRRGEPLDPEMALLRALLQDAVYEYRKYASACDRRGQRRFREAEAWFKEGRCDWIFSFRNVCEHLGVNPDYILRGLSESRLSHPKT